jgi:hypothetical protein
MYDISTLLRNVSILMQSTLPLRSPLLSSQDLLTFEKNDIHWAQMGKVNIIFFKSQLIHTFTESKDSNCFILYFEEILVFWNEM